MIDPSSCRIPRILRPRRAAPADAVRPTRAEVNLGALRQNLHVVRSHAGRGAVWPVLKADAYGHGAPAVARTLERAGADGFCVALYEEGLELREAGIRAPILVMGGYYGHVHREVIERHLVPVVYDIAQVEGFAQIVRVGEIEGPIRLHVKVDTGMGRLGVTLRELPGFAARLAKIPEVMVEGLMTHLAGADAGGEESAREQVECFEQARLVLLRVGIRPEVEHVANSAGLFRGVGMYQAVRPGIALFGVSPRIGDGEAMTPDLRDVMRVRTEIVAVRELSKGDRVGYNFEWSALRASRIATVPMGYADGLSRLVSNSGFMLVRGQRVPVVGVVSMDLTTIDITNVSGASVGDEVVVLGSQEGPRGRDSITVDEIALRTRTIPYEILTSISRRVPRFYREP